MEKSPEKKRNRRDRVEKFVVPTREERLAALGTFEETEGQLESALLSIFDEFEEIKTPKPGDNLYQNTESGQTYTKFCTTSRHHIDKERQAIYITTFHCNISQKALATIQQRAKAFFFGATVKVLHMGKTDLNRFDPLTSQFREKYYNAGKLNAYFANRLPKDAFSIAVITNLLLYNAGNTREGLAQKWVFGLGSMRDRSSVISFQEILKRGYGSKRKQKQADESPFHIDFLTRVVLHELCHTFAMRHCIFHSCLMNGSNHYEEAATKEGHICAICLRKLHKQLRFDLSARYAALGDAKSVKLLGRIESTLPGKTN